MTRGRLKELGSYDSYDFINVAVEDVGSSLLRALVPTRTLWISHGPTVGQLRFLLSEAGHATHAVSTHPAESGWFRDGLPDAKKWGDFYGKLRQSWRAVMPGEFPLASQELETLMLSLRPGDYIELEVPLVY